MTDEELVAIMSAIYMGYNPSADHHVILVKACDMLEKVRKEIKKRGWNASPIVEAAAAPLKVGEPSTKITPPDTVPGMKPSEPHKILGVLGAHELGIPVVPVEPAEVAASGVIFQNMGTAGPITVTQAAPPTPAATVTPKPVLYSCREFVCTCGSDDLIFNFYKPGVEAAWKCAKCGTQETMPVTPQQEAELKAKCKLIDGTVKATKPVQSRPANVSEEVKTKVDAVVNSEPTVIAVDAARKEVELVVKGWTVEYLTKKYEKLTGKLYTKETVGDMQKAVVECMVSG